MGSGSTVCSNPISQLVISELQDGLSVKLMEEYTAADANLIHLQISRPEVAILISRLRLQVEYRSKRFCAGKFEQKANTPEYDINIVLRRKVAKQ